MKRYKPMRFGKVVCIVDTYNRNLFLRDESNELITFIDTDLAESFCKILEDEVREGYVATVDDEMLKKCNQGVNTCQ